MAAFDASNFIFTPLEWERGYPLAHYNRTPHAKKHFVHYWAIINQNLELITAFFAKKKDAEAELVKSLTLRDKSHMKLTPLMIAAMRGHLRFGQFLLNSIKERTTPEKFIKHLNKVDSNGFTALHHAAIAAPSLVKVLLENGANPNAKTKARYSYEHLRLLTDPTLEADSAGKTFWEVNGELKKVSELTPAEKEQIGITRFRDLYLYQGSSNLHDLWDQTPLEAESPKAVGCPNASLKSLPELEIRRHPTLPDGNVGLFAKTFLPQGTLISTCGGVFTPRKPTFWIFDAQVKNYREGNESEYIFLRDCNGQRLCSPMTRANTGFPNAVVQTMLVDEMPIDGLTVFASKGIQPGEEILFYYGYDDCLIWDKQILLEKEKIDAFASPGLLSICFGRDTSPNHIFFLMNNPKALIYIHMKRHILAQEWIQCFREYYCWAKKSIPFSSKKFNPLLLFGEKESFLQKMFSVVNILNNFEKAFVRIPPSHQESLKHWILDAIDTHSVFQITRVMELVSRESDLNSFHLDKVIEGIAEYDWLNDPESSLRERNARRLLNRFQLNEAAIPIDELIETYEKKLKELREMRNYRDVNDVQIIVDETMPPMSFEDGNKAFQQKKQRFEALQNCGDVNDVELIMQEQLDDLRQEKAQISARGARN